MTLTEILTKFENPKKSGQGYQVKCPAHADRVASLSISNGGDKILLHCHAGCSADSIVSAVGLRMTDLFSGPRQQPVGGLGYFKGAPITAIYEYRDAAGKLIYRVIRNEKKNF